MMPTSTEPSGRTEPNVGQVLGHIEQHYVFIAVDRNNKVAVGLVINNINLIIPVVANANALAEAAESFGYRQWMYAGHSLRWRTSRATNHLTEVVSGARFLTVSRSCSDLRFATLRAETKSSGHLSVLGRVPYFGARLGYWRDLELLVFLTSLTLITHDHGSY
jgi:hypothetical protein